MLNGILFGTGKRPAECKMHHLLTGIAEYLWLLTALALSAPLLNCCTWCKHMYLYCCLLCLDHTEDIRRINPQRLSRYLLQTFDCRYERWRSFRCCHVKESWLTLLDCMENELLSAIISDGSAGKVERDVNSPKRLFLSFCVPLTWKGNAEMLLRTSYSAVPLYWSFILSSCPRSICLPLEMCVHGVLSSSFL